MFKVISLDISYCGKQSESPKRESKVWNYDAAGAPTSCYNLRCQAIGNEMNLQVSFSVFILFSKLWSSASEKKNLPWGLLLFHTVHKGYYKHLAFGSQPYNTPRFYDSRAVTQVSRSPVPYNVIKWKASNICLCAFFIGHLTKWGNTVYNY